MENTIELYAYMRRQSWVIIMQYALLVANTLLFQFARNCNSNNF